MHALHRVLVAHAPQASASCAATHALLVATGVLTASWALHLAPMQIIKYTVAVPPWMHAWCGRWGPGRDGQLHMYALHAYTPCGTQTRVLYVPDFGV